MLGDYLEAVKKDYEKASKVFKNNCDDRSQLREELSQVWELYAGRPWTRQGELQRSLQVFRQGMPTERDRFLPKPGFNASHE